MTNWATRLVLVMAVFAGGCAVDQPADDDGEADEGAVGQTSAALASFGGSIQSRSSNKCVAVGGVSTALNALIEQRTCDGSAPQQFVIEIMGAGVVRIRNSKSGFCVTPVGFTNASTPMPLAQASCASTQALWRRDGTVALSTGGTRSGFRWNADSRFCLDVPGNLEGQQLRAAPCVVGAANQSFDQRPPDTTPPAVTIAVFFNDASGNLVSQFVTSNAGPNNQDLHLVLPRRTEYTIFTSASDNVGLKSLSSGCGSRFRLNTNGTESSSTPSCVAGALANAPTYTISGSSFGPLDDRSVLLEIAEYSGAAVDTSQNRVTSPKLTIQRM